jgi:hypothetical protein
MVREYVIEHLADDDAVLVVDETGFLKQGNSSCGRCTAVHGVSREDHELPDRRVRYLCVAPRTCFHRLSALTKSWIDDPARLKAT